MSDTGTNDKLDLILSEVSRIRDEIASLRQEFKNDMVSVRLELSIHQEKIAKAEQRIDDAAKERDRLMITLDNKVTDIYDDIDGAKRSVMSMIENMEKSQRATCESNRINGKQYVRNFILSGLVTVLIAISAFFIVRIIDKIDSTIHYEKINTVNMKANK